MAGFRDQITKLDRGKESTMNAQNDDFSEKIRYFLDECTKGFSPDLIEYLKTGFQTSVINGFDNKEMDLQIKIVVDTNVVIKSLRHYAKTGKSSLLLKLESNPLFPLYSPTDLEDEVSDYIDNKEKDPKNRPKMREMWSFDQNKHYCSRKNSNRIMEQGKGGHRQERLR